MPQEEWVSRYADLPTETGTQFQLQVISQLVPQGFLTSTIRTQKWDKLIQSNSFMTGLLKVCQASDSWKGEGTHFCSSDLIFNDFSVVFEDLSRFSSCHC